jgi:predicted phosphoadenosine phosphosulfate sulfurtransferase
MSDADYVSQSWWGQEGLGKNVWEAAVDRCIQVLETFEDYYVSFSGGKDSTAVLEAVLAAHDVLGLKEPVKVVYFDEEVVHPETDEYVIRCIGSKPIDLHWYCLPVLQRNSCSMESPAWYPWGEEVRDLWVRDLPERATHTVENTPWFPNHPIESRPTLAAAGPYFFYDWLKETPGKKRSAIFLGIRVAESMMRRMIIARHRDHPEHWMSHLGNANRKLAWCSKVYPIFDFTENDIWAAPREFGWDYNRVYDQFEALGLPPSAQRIGTPFGEEPSRGLWTWHQLAPELWDKMLYRVPGVVSAYRYSNSVIYGKGETGGVGASAALPELSPGQTYREMLREVINNYPDPAMRVTVAKTCKAMLKRHQKNTSDPILPRSGHPVTGISWLQIFKIATIGDVKSRRSMMRPNKEQKPKMQAAYDEELNLIKLEGRLHEIM